MVALAQDNYLFALASLALTVLKYKPVETAVYVPTMVKTPETEAFLNGYGLLLVTQKGHELNPSIKGQFKKGLMSICKSLIQEFKAIDVRWFKFFELPHVTELLFGEAWATKYQIEKKIFDWIISATRALNLAGPWLNSYLRPLQEIQRAIGFTEVHKSAVFTTEEIGFIEEDFRDYLKRVKTFKVPEITPESAQDFQDYIKETQTMGRTYKTLINSEIDKRMKLLYSGNKTEKKKKAKIPIGELVNQQKGSIEYVNTFQPNRIARLEQFIITGIPKDKIGWDQLGVQLSEWLARQKGTQVTNRGAYCKNWLLAAAQS